MGNKSTFNSIVVQSLFSGLPAKPDARFIVGAAPSITHHKNSPYRALLEFSGLGATCPLAAVKKRHHSPYSSDFGRFCRPLEALCLVLALPFPFLVTDRSLPFLGLTRCKLGWWVIHGATPGCTGQKRRARKIWHQRRLPAQPT